MAAFAEAQYSFHLIELQTYLQRLDEFNIPGKGENAHALSAEAEARTEAVLSVLDGFQGSPDLPADACWKQLGLAQDLYTQVTKLDTSDAKERKAAVYESKGNVELLRHRLASSPGSTLSDGIQRSARTLIQNAMTFYKGAAQLAKADGEDEVETKARQRWFIAAQIAGALYDAELKESPFGGLEKNIRGDIVQELEDCVEEGILDMAVGEEIVKRLR